MRTVRYLLYSQIIQAVLFVALAFLALFYLIDMVEEMQNMGNDIYVWQQAAIKSLLGVPAHLYDLMPIALLIGSVYALAQLAQSSEFTILRTAGLGPDRVLLLLAGIGLVGGIFTFVLGETLVPLAEQQGSALQALVKPAGLSKSEKGAWLKDSHMMADGEHTYIVNVAQALDMAHFRDVSIYEFDHQGYLVQRVRAAKASVDTAGVWQLTGVQLSRFIAGEQPAQSQSDDSVLPSMTWHSRLTDSVVAAAILPLKTMSTRALYTYMKHLSEHEQAGQLYEIQFWKKVLYPLVSLVMMSLALPFAYMHARKGGISFRVFIGIMLGISFVLINNVANHLGVLQGWRPWLAATTPSLVYMLLALGAFSWFVRYR